MRSAMLAAATALLSITVIGSASAAPVPVAGSGFTELEPVRVLDTRGGAGIPVAGGASVTLDLSAKVPESATAVVLNVTGTAPTRDTYVTVFPHGAERPTASNLNLSAGETRPNLVTVAIGVGRKVELFNNAGSVHLVADLAGFYAADAGVKFASLDPVRVLDTRSSAPVSQGGTVTIDLSAKVPAWATAVTFNLTGTAPTSSTFVTAWPTGTARPTASNLNLVAGQTSPNLVTVALGADRKVSLFNNAGTVQLVADLAGYYGKDADLLFTPVAPVRAVDTRDANQPVLPNNPVTIDLKTAIRGLTATPVAVVFNLTGTAPTTATYVTASPGARTATSNLNLVTGQTAANLVTVGVTPAATFALHNNAGSVHLIADIAGYFTRGCASASGCVFSWGANSAGQLGDGSTQASRATPGPVFGLPGIIQISAGTRENIALRADGAVFVWGDGDVVPGPAIAYSPVAIPQLAADVEQVSATDDNALALKSDGTVWAWGDGEFGQLGNGGTADSAVPVRVGSLTGVRAVAMGATTGYAMKSDGTVWAWGDNRKGSLGNGTTCVPATGVNCHSTAPVQVTGLTGVIAISEDGFALRADQTVWTWGANDAGLLGTDATQSSTTPAQVTALADVVQISGGNTNRYAMRADGTVWAWGANSEGQLGNGAGGGVSAVPVQVSGIDDAIGIGFGEGHTGYAVRADGSAWGWGHNLNGELGPDVATATSEVPVRIGGLNGVTAISGYSHGALALVDSGQR
ncbi:RCC1 domain-containing protein [Actinokineospora xionganensis]|nr:hypothetical protein [Actinokineospora xionganensis]